MALIARPSMTQMISELKDASSFTHSQCESIIDYLWDLSEDCGEDMEFDPVGIRCDVNSHTWEQIREYYSNIQDIADAEDNDELLEALQDHTCIITYDDDRVLFFAF